MLFFWFSFFYLYLSVECCQVADNEFVAGVIDKNAYAGVESLLNDINIALLAEVDLSNLKRTRRRRRRVGSKGDPPDVLLASQTDKVKDIHKSTQIPQRKLSEFPMLHFDMFFMSVDFLCP